MLLSISMFEGNNQNVSFKILNSVFCFFFNSHPSGCKVVSYCGFDLHLNCVEHLFMCFLTIWIWSGTLLI